jgi:hypothetical protein
MAFSCYENIVFDADAANREVAVQSFLVDVLGVYRRR